MAATTDYQSIATTPWAFLRSILCLDRIFARQSLAKRGLVKFQVFAPFLNLQQHKSALFYHRQIF